MSRKLFAILGILFWVALGHAADPVLPSFEGLPQIGLPTSTYEPFVANRLARARVLWVNYDLLREMGVEVPDGKLTPEIENWLLDQFGYAVKRGNEPKGTFFERTKKFFADRYGGRGMNGNLGSARSASVSRFSIKGIGKTPMLGSKADAIHSSGGLGVSQSTREAMWSKLLGQEMPHGANRVLAVISTGATTRLVASIDESGSLLIREDPLRPAHFMPNLHAEGPAKEADERRVRDVYQMLEESLPVPAGGENLKGNARLRSGFNEYIDRVVDQYAFAYANRLYHGAASPSNIDLNGKLLDLPTYTVLDGYPQAMLADLAPFGDTTPIEKELILEVAHDLKKQLSPDAREAIPDDTTIQERFRRRYSSRFKIEMVKQTGAPSEWIEALGNDPPVLKLGEELERLAFSGHDHRVQTGLNVPKNQGDYDILKILKALGRDPLAPREKLELLLSQAVKDPTDRAKLADAYAKVMQALVKKAEHEKISRANLENYIRETSAFRNEDRTALYRRYWTFVKRIFASLAWKKEPNAGFQQSVDQLADKNQRVFRDTDPLVTVLSNEVDAGRGITLRKVFDARTGAYRDVVRVHAPRETLGFFGDSIRRSDLESAALFKEGQSVGAAGSKKGDWIEFTLPGVRDRKLESFEIRTSDGSKRWVVSSKNGAFNLVSRFNSAAECFRLYSTGLGAVPR